MSLVGSCGLCLFVWSRLSNQSCKRRERAWRLSRPGAVRGMGVQLGKRAQQRSKSATRTYAENLAICVDANSRLEAQKQSQVNSGLMKKCYPSSMLSGCGRVPISRCSGNRTTYIGRHHTHRKHDGEKRNFHAWVTKESARFHQFNATRERGSQHWPFQHEAIRP